MGLCFEADTLDFPKIDIIKKDGDDLEDDKNLSKDAAFPGNKKSIPKEKLKIILHQKKSICKIIKKEKGIGTGFLCYMEEFKKIKCLITAYHVLGEEDLKIGNEIKITFNEDNEKIETIKLNKLNESRYILANKKEDITIIEILDSDNLNNYKALEIDQNIYDYNIDYYNEYKKKDIYILHYPEGKFLNFSDNTVIYIDKNNHIFHRCGTDHGSSGAPILNLDNFKVIGVHQGSGNFEKKMFHNQAIINLQNESNIENTIFCNFGKLLKESIYNFNKENKIILTLKIKDYEIGQKIYFLQKFDEKNDQYIKNHKINLNNFDILINDKNYESKEYFLPKKEGKYYIKILIKNNINDCFGLFYQCSNIINADLSCFNTKNVTNMSKMFCGCYNLEAINLSCFNTKNVTNMSLMFYECKNLENINLSSFNTKNVTNMSFMFSDCKNLKNINLASFDTKNVTNMSGMFFFCEKLENINFSSSFDTKNVTNMSEIFCNCQSLENINLSSFITTNVIDMYGMFFDCYNLKHLDLSSFDTKNVTDMKCMFNNCYKLVSLDISSFDTKNVTNKSPMFDYKHSLTIISSSSFGKKSVINMMDMFSGCYKLKNNPNFHYKKDDIKIINQLKDENILE